MVWHSRAERVVLGPLLRGGLGPLLLLVGAPPLIGTGLAGGGGGHLDRASRDAAAAHVLGELLELVGRLVDRLQMTLMLVLTTRRGDIGMPALCHPPARELDAALIKRRLELQQEHCLFDVEDPWHDSLTVATMPRRCG